MFVLINYPLISDPRLVNGKKKGTNCIFILVLLNNKLALFFLAKWYKIISKENWKFFFRRTILSVMQVFLCLLRHVALLIIITFRTIVISLEKTQWLLVFHRKVGKILFTFLISRSQLLWWRKQCIKHLVICHMPQIDMEYLQQQVLG